MRDGKALSIASMFILFLFAGCLGGGDEEEVQDDEPIPENPVLTELRRELDFTVDSAGGEAPHNVTFTASVSAEEVPVTEEDSDAATNGTEENNTSALRLPAPGFRQAMTGNATDNGTSSAGHPAGNFTWSLLFGDGSDGLRGDQSGFPLNATHVYTVGGDYTATLSVLFEDGESLYEETPVNVTVPPAEPREMPDQLVFEFGPSTGCTGDVQGTLCVTYVMGPGSEGIDGFWVPLDERYWGLSMVSAADVPNALGDTDGLFVDVSGEDMAEDINNGSGPAEGKVPGNAAWLFIYSYGVPSASLTVTFS